MKGWSRGAVRRHTRWLYGIDAGWLDFDQDTGEILQGYAVTLTLRDLPPTSLEWTSHLRAWFAWLERNDVRRVHWVVEWQRRGVPHVHAALYWADGWRSDNGWEGGEAAAGAWLVRAAKWGASPGAQVWDRIDGPLGWLQYLSKHAARGVQHYQRQGKPEGWEKTGRLWGYRGQWPMVEPEELHVSREVYWRFRRLARAWRVAQHRNAAVRATEPAERAQGWTRVKYARRMLQAPERRLSEVRGVSEWIPQDVAARLLAIAGAEIA